MILNTKLTLLACLWALTASIVPVQASNVKMNSDPSTERVKRRSFFNFPYSRGMATRNSVSLYDASNTYRAAPYTVPRPYYIPVYGAPGRPLIFYPPQPIYVNPGMPQDNPSVPFFGGSGYLPPKESPHFGGDTYLPPKERPATTTPKSKVPPRLGGDDDDDDDAPIWGSSGGIVQMPLSGGQNKESNPIPTRAPVGKASAPPLVHNVQSSSGADQFSSDFVQSSSSAPQAQSGNRPTLRTSTVAPPPGPSNCVWAIISCCTASSPNVIPQNCFDQRGCPGPFWGSSPCASDYAKAAIEAAVKYYNGNPRSPLGK